MKYTQADYERERAICDKASAYWKANATLSAHPDYAACTNEMLVRVAGGSLIEFSQSEFFLWRIQCA